MILGIGIDLLDVRRMTREVARDPGFLGEVLTPAEVKHCSKSSRPFGRSATTFAAKEALFKALGTGKRGRMSWHDIEVRWNPPGMVLTGATKRVSERLGVEKIHLDLVNEEGYGATVVVLEGPRKSGRKRHGV
jgi:holo-[acyl-carrier protein] synthase